METRRYWEENGHSVKFENYPEEYPSAPSHGDQLNFAAHSEDEAEYPQSAFLKKGKVTRQDPMSHRIIEKRRRDRMNNCLADLSRLIPPEYLKKGRGRIEKTEIIEMAIRHLKYLGERAKATERQIPEFNDHFRAGYQEAAAEAVRFLVEVQGYGPRDAICVQLATHMQRHSELLGKGNMPREKTRYQNHNANGNGGSSSETTSTSSSVNGNTGNVNGYGKTGVITRTEPEHPRYAEPYEQSVRSENSFNMECDGTSSAVSTNPTEESTSQPDEPLDARRKREPTLRAIRKPELNEDYLHLYKFKNSIERRFSRSQDNEAHDMSVQPAHAHGRHYSHKRRRAVKPPSTTTSNSGSTEDTRDTSPQDTSSESPHHHIYDKPAVTHMAQYVPVFALNALGKYYVPMNIEYACLAKHLGPYDVLDARAAGLTAPLHPVTIHVNFQPFLSYVKRETDREWRAT